MKYSQQIGIIACLLLIAVCFMPWIELPALQKTLSGVNGKVNSNITFGKPVILHSVLCGFSIVLFLLPKIGAKRTNIFIALLNLSLTIKSFILYRMCRPECPVTKPALYALLALGLLIQLMALLPKISVNENKQ